MFWRCGRAANAYMSHRKNLTPGTSQWLLLNTFQILKRSSKHHGQTFNIMVWLHLNCQKDHHCYPHCPQRTSQEDGLKYWMSAQSGESTVIRPKVMRIVHLKAFLTPKIGLTGMVRWIIQMWAMTAGGQTTGRISRLRMALMHRQPQSTGMCVPLQMFPDWSCQHGGHWNRLQKCWWWSLQWKQGEVKDTTQSRTEWVNMCSPGSICCLTKNFT